LFTLVAGAYNLFPEENLSVIHRVWIYLRVYEPLHVHALMEEKEVRTAEILGKKCSVGIGAAVSLI
jgi:hypothetical protein